MKAPGFWYRPPGVAATLLAPLGWAYALAGGWRRARAIPLDLAIPVICVGNLVAGGTGKTPVALALTGRLQAWGLTVHCLTRGYGGDQRGPLTVQPERHQAAAVGDEALLLAAQAPTWVARERAAGARAALAAGAAALVLDDGFQNPALAYRLGLVVVDGAVGFGNGRVIPAGPLREPVTTGLARASAVVVIGEDRCGVAAAVGALPLLQARLVPDAAVAAALRGRRVLAFAGIGRPAKFFETLAGLGAELIETVAFPDHYRYPPEVLARLLARARGCDALAVTTVKDAVRLPAEVREQVSVLPVTVAWHDEAALDRLLAAALEQRGAHDDGQAQ